MDRDQLFTQRRRDAAVLRDRLAFRVARVANIRLAVFLLGIGALVWGEVRPQQGAVALSMVGLAVVAFVVLVVVHGRLSQAELHAAMKGTVNDEALARLRRDWDALPDPGNPAPREHPFARDLDVFGHGSLARFLSATGTRVGRRRLHNWLLAPAPFPEIGARQAALDELAGRLDFRQELQVAGRLAGEERPEALEAFLSWAEGEPWLHRRPLLLWTARLIPLATAVLAVLQVQGLVVRPWWILTLAAGGVLAMALGRSVHRVLAEASLGDASLRRYAELVGIIQEAEFTAPPLQEIHAALSGEVDARKELERLGWLTELADLRHGGIFYVLIHLPTLWDFQVLAALERWQDRVGSRVRGWGDAVARLDALCALAAPLHDEDDWCFPTPSEAPRLEARALAHPLLPPEERVANNVTVGPPGSFLMVTGSNMSGKSTLLRAVGVNAVLAGAGGPVCAAHMEFPALELRTSMRVDDSLERGVSLFMAELQQLKRVVDAADVLGNGERAAQGPEVADSGVARSGSDDHGSGSSGPVLLYLLDEILHGTNSAERQVAVREVLAHLLARRAIGAISTHDLALAESEPLAGSVVSVHFRETLHPEGHEPPMTFDYTLREGIATSSNALKLVRLVGLT